MRAAARRDNWRYVLERSHPFELHSITLENFRGIGSPTLSAPASNLIAICGHNGSGKTTLLKCIEAAIKEDLSKLPRSALSTEFQIQLDVKFRGQAYSFGLPTHQGSDTDRWRDDFVVLLEPANESPELLKQLKNTTDLDEIVESVEFRELDTALHSYVVGKKYEKIEVSEIEIGSDHDLVPYFIVRSHGVEYKSEEMGLGEFSVFYIIWRLTMASEGSLVLVEEPESFISPRSQAALADVFAKYIVDKKLCLVCTTHSSFFIERAPKESVHILSRLPNGLCAISPATEANEHLAVLGVTEQPKGIIFVEDLTAQLLTESILRHYRSNILKTVSLVRCGGHSEAVGALTGIPSQGHPLIFVAVLDGDQRNGEYSNLEDVMYLPCGGDPDLELISVISEDTARFATKLFIDRVELMQHMANLAGVEHHDFVPELSRLVNIPIPHILRAMCACWIENGSHAAECRDLCDALHARFG